MATDITPAPSAAAFGPVTIAAMTDIATLVSIGQLMNGTAATYRGVASESGTNIYARLKKPAKKVRAHLRSAAGEIGLQLFRTRTATNDVDYASLNAIRRTHIATLDQALEDILPMVKAETNLDTGGPRIVVLKTVYERLQNVVAFWKYETTEAADITATRD